MVFWRTYKLWKLEAYVWLNDKKTEGCWVMQEEFDTYETIIDVFRDSFMIKQEPFKVRISARDNKTNVYFPVFVSQSMNWEDKDSIIDKACREPIENTKPRRDRKDFKGLALTPLEKEIHGYMEKGLLLPEIALRMCRKESVITVYMSHIRKKLGIPNEYLDYSFTPHELKLTNQEEIVYYILRDNPHFTYRQVAAIVGYDTTLSSISSAMTTVKRKIRDKMEIKQSAK